MPRPRPRPQREPCDCLDCSDRVPSSVGPQSAGGPARQDPPPKSLLIYLANAACTAAGGAAALAEARTPHLDAAVRAGYSGLLAFQPGPPELEQLLAPPAGQADGATLAERFMDLRVAMLAGGPEAAGVGLAAGCHSVRRLDGEGGAPPEPARVAELIQACRGEDIDMILLALDAQTLAAQPGCGSSDQDAACGALEWADALVRELNQAPGFRGTVLLTLVLGPGPGPAATVPLAEEDPPLIQPLSGTLSADGQLVAAPVDDFPPVRRPLQSYQFSGTRRVAVVGGRRALVVHRLAGVVRRDEAAALGEAAARGAGGVILAERLLPEVAYKLGRAPKYGA